MKTIIIIAAVAFAIWLVLNIPVAPSYTCYGVEWDAKALPGTCAHPIK